MTKIKSSNLDVDVVTGLTEDTSPAADDVIITYDTSAGSLKKVQKSNFSLAAPEITSISPTVVDPDGSTTTNITINGVGFVNPPAVKFVGTDATEYTSGSVTFNSSAQIVAATTASMTAANGPYDVKVINGNNLTVTGFNLLTLDNAPYWNIAANTNLGSVYPGATSFTHLTVPEARDLESDAVTHTISAGALPTGMTMNTDATFAGTVADPLADQDFTFTVQAATTNWTVTRQFVITNAGPAFISASGGTETTSGDYKIHSFINSGCFVVASVGNGCLVPTGGSNEVSYLVVGGGGGGGGGHGGPPDTGGGGGAGGYRTSGSINGYTAPAKGTCVAGITITATTYPITVGGGGGGGGSPFSTGGKGGSSTFSTITSGGGGHGQGNAPYNGGPGASGGGGRGAYGPHSGGSGNSPPVSPPQGNSGGPAPHGAEGGGGGGATQGGNAGDGGNGDYNDITGAQVGYSGGGAGGNGGGAPGAWGEGSSRADPADANRGGGGAGGPTSGGSGGKGIVIIRYKYQ